jgi:sirohydrochlorin cobaltochelatase
MNRPSTIWPKSKMSANARPDNDCDPESVAWLLVGHGTRDAAGLAEFDQTVRLVAERAGGHCVRHAFLELAEPSIEDAVRDLYHAGIRRVVVVPLLLFAAAHSKRDIPNAMARAESNFADLRWRQTPHFGCHEKIFDLARQRYQAAFAQLGGCDTLLLVGRGSNDEQATTEMLQFARLHSENVMPSAIEVAFIAMAQPRVNDALARIGQSPARRIIVQPHLLFAGELLHQVGKSASAAGREYPGKRWLCSDHLGPTPELAGIILDLARNTAAGYDQ